MIENDPSNVASAFEMLLEEVEAEIDFINGIGAKAFEGRDYGRAKEALERSGILTEFRDRVAAFRKEREELAAAAEREDDEATRTERRDLGRLRKGLRTREAAYYPTILKTRAAMGGKGKMNEVLDRVGVLMKGSLKDVDYEPLASDPDRPR